MVAGGGQENSVSIDRIDNRQGYLQANVIACCYKCNSIKGRVEGAMMTGDINLLKAFVTKVERIYQSPA